MLALRTMRIFAANMFSLFCGPIILNIEQAAASWRFDAAGGGLTPSRPSRVILRCCAQLHFEARSSYVVQLLVQHDDFLGTHAIIKQVRSSQTRRLSQHFDLQINQLANFTFDGGGWLSHHAATRWNCSSYLAACPERARHRTACASTDIGIPGRICHFSVTDNSLGREKKSHNSYMRRRVIRPVATSAAAQSKSKLNHALRRKARPSFR